MGSLPLQDAPYQVMWPWRHLHWVFWNHRSIFQWIFCTSGSGNIQHLHNNEPYVKRKHVDSAQARNLLARSGFHFLLFLKLVRNTTIKCNKRWDEFKEFSLSKWVFLQFSFLTKRNVNCTPTSAFLVHPVAQESWVQFRYYGRNELSRRMTEVAGTGIEKKHKVNHCGLEESAEFSWPWCPRQTKVTRGGLFCACNPRRGSRGHCS